MSAFASTTELHRVVGEFFRYVASSRAGRSVADAKIVAAFVFSAPAGRVVLDGRSERPPGQHFIVHTGNHGPPADVTFSMTADAAEHVFTGGTPIVVALANGTIRARGAIGRALPLVPAVSRWIPLYVRWRERDGE